MPKLIARRGFLLSLGAVGGGLVGAGFVWRWYARAEARLVGRLADSLAKSEEAQELGKAYLVQHPEEASADLLTSALSSETDTPPFHVDAEELRRSFRAHVTQDFEQGRTVKLDGWVFSRTELRLCALAALRAEGRMTPAVLGVLAHRHVTLESVSQPKPEGSNSTEPGAVVFEEGLTISLNREYRPREIELTVDADDTYDVIYFADGVEVGTQVIRPKDREGGSLALYRRPTPFRGQPIDAVRILRRHGQYPYSLGHLHLIE